MSAISNQSQDGGVQEQGNSQPSWPENVPIPDLFLCPLTKRLMKHPVIDREGNSYERDTMLRYLRQQGDAGKGFSPVTKNPLQESDLVDNKGLQMAIEAALKSAIEQDHGADQSRRKPKGRRFRIANQLTSSVKVAMHSMVLTTRNGKEKYDCEEESPSPGGGEEDRVTLDSGGGGDSLGREEPIHGSKHVEEKHHRTRNHSRHNRRRKRRGKPEESTRSMTTGNAVLDAEIAAFLQSGECGTLSKDAVPDDSSAIPKPQTKIGAHYIPSGAPSEKSAARNDGESRSREDKSAAEKFEERLLKKLSGDTAPHAKYERKNETTDSVKQSSVNSVQESHKERLLLKKLSEDRKKKQTGSVKKSSGNSVPESNKERLLLKKLSEDTAPHAKYERDSVRESNGNSVQESHGERLRKKLSEDYEQKKKQTGSVKISPVSSIGGNSVPESKSRIKTQTKELNEVQIVKTEAVNQDKYEKILERKLSGLTEYSKKSHTSTVPKKKEEGPKQSKPEASSIGEPDYLQLQEERSRQRRGRRGMLNKKLESMSSISTTRSAALVQFREAWSSSRRLSDLTHTDYEDNILETSDSNHSFNGDEKSLQLEADGTVSRESSSCKGHNSASSKDNLANNKHHGNVMPSMNAAYPRSGSYLKRISSTGEMSECLNGSVHSGRRDGRVSWTDLDGDISRAVLMSTKMTNTDAIKIQRELDDDMERALLMSMKTTNIDAMKIQRELESHMQGGVDVDATPSGGGGGGAIAQRRSKGRRGGSRRQEIRENLSDDIDADMVDEILGGAVLEGSGKTRFDVLDALNEARGDRDRALAILLGFESSFRSI